MNWRSIVQLHRDVYWVGSRDWNRRLFDALIPLPAGTSYNAYLIIGKSKKALIDTVNPGFERELEEKVSQVADLKDLDYVVMNHAEPDHAGAIPYVMGMNSKARLVATKKGAKMAEIFYGVSEARTQVVGDGSAIDLGGKTLQFIEAPMLHWPETMFTYLPGDNTLFPCDFFGSHIAKGTYDSDLPDLPVHAQRYFGEIMMPFRTMAQAALEKIKQLKIDMIAPSHGPIYRTPKTILESYHRWSRGETRNKVVIVYVTMWNSTEKMIQPIAETLSNNGIEIGLHNLTVTDLGELARDLVDSKAIVLGAPTVLGGAHPLAIYAAFLVRALHPPTKFGAILGSYGWNRGGVAQMREMLSQTEIEIVGTHDVNGPPTEEDVKKIAEIGRVLAERIQAEP